MDPQAGPNGKATAVNPTAAEAEPATDVDVGRIVRNEAGRAKPPPASLVCITGICSVGYCVWRRYALPCFIVRKIPLCFLYAQQEHPVLCGTPAFRSILRIVLVLQLRHLNHLLFLLRKSSIQEITVQPLPQPAFLPYDWLFLCVVWLTVKGISTD